MNDIILFGMQGSGKGTQGALLAEKYNSIVFDTGSALRKIASEDSPLGNKVKTIIESGDLVPTEIVMEVIEDFVNKIPQEKFVIFDGIPRNEEQRDQFNALMSKLNKQPTVIYINIPREEAEKRLLSRKICKQCKKIFPGNISSPDCTNCEGGALETRSDDNPEAIKKRLDVFFEKTVPVIESYQEDYTFLNIDGTPPISEVSQNIVEQISNS